VVDFIADVDLAAHYEVHFINSFELMEDDCVGSKLDWFEHLEDEDHEVEVDLVVEGVERVNVLRRVVLEGIEQFEFIEVPCEQEVGVDLALDIFGQLVQNAEVLFSLDSLVPVVLPPVVEVVFHSQAQLLL